jgi:hypothetical protein
MNEQEVGDTAEVNLMQWMSVDQLDRYGDATRVMEEVKAGQPKMDREFAEQNRLNERLTLEELLEDSYVILADTATMRAWNRGRRRAPRSSHRER